MKKSLQLVMLISTITTWRVNSSIIKLLWKMVHPSLITTLRRQNILSIFNQRRTTLRKRVVRSLKSTKKSNQSNKTSVLLSYLNEKQYLRMQLLPRSMWSIKSKALKRSLTSNQTHRKCCQFNRNLRVEQLCLEKGTKQDSRFSRATSWARCMK